jgi:hypothetical protein
MVELPLLPVFVVGPPGVGKRTIVASLRGRAEGGAVFRQFDVDGRSYLLRIVAAAHLEAVPFEVFAETRIFVFVFDESAPDSLGALGALFDGAAALADLSAADGAALLLLGSKWDLSTADAGARGRAFAAAHWDILFYEVSHFDAGRIEAAFTAILRRYLAPSYYAGDGLAPQPAPGRRCEIRSHAHPQFALDIRDVSKSPGARLTIWERHGGENQQWTIDFAKKTIVSVNSGLVLSIVGDAVEQMPDDGGEHQQWELHPEDGTIRAVNGLVCLDLRGKPQKGTEIWAAPIGRAESQRWDIRPLA